MRFMAPECFRLEKNKQFHGKRVDIWAAGITLYLLLTNKYPFCGQTQQQIEWEIMNKEPPLKEIDNKEIRELIRKMLNKDPDKRIEVSDIMKDKWVSSSGFDPVELDISSHDSFISS